MLFSVSMAYFSYLSFIGEKKPHPKPKGVIPKIGDTLGGGGWRWGRQNVT